MKKLVTLFVICAAVAAQAAYVDWQYAVSEAKTGGTDWTSGHTAYLLDAATWDSIKDEFTQATLASSALDSSTFFQQSSTKSAVVYRTGGTAAGVRQVAADSGNYYVILATSDGYNIAVNNATITAYADSTGAGTGLTPGITVSTAVSGSGISFTAYPTGGSGDIPEPTSGLLLLVGAGMLALRRKQK